MSLFGSNTGNTFGGNLGSNSNSKPPLTRSLSAGGSGGGGLFGNSSTQNQSSTNGLFGSSNTTNNSTNNNQSLFGGASNTNNSTGLFGNTQGASQSNSSGLFGNNNPPQTSNLFGNSQNSNSNASSLFNNTNNTSNSTGLFGNSSASNTTNSTGLFGNTNQPKSTGLFANNNSMPQTENKFGGGLFGSSSGGSNNNLFGNKQQFSTTAPDNNSNSLNITKNPYNYNESVMNIQNSLSSMPRSITESIFVNDKSKETDKAKRFTSVDNSKSDKQQKSSILSRLGQTFKLLRKDKSTANFSAFTGLFTQSNFIQPEDKKKITPHSPSIPLSGSRKLFRSNLDSRALGSIKKLVIKSKPAKYHSINADKVLSVKKRNVSGVVTSNKLLTDYSSDEDIETNEGQNDVDNIRYNRFPYNTEALNRHGKTVLSGEEERNASVSQKIVDGEITSTKENSKASENVESENYQGYWCSPSIQELSQLTVDSLKSVENFMIGRVGFGQIAFNFPVDLTSLTTTNIASDSSLRDVLFGNVVRINSKNVEVYREGMYKPPVGSGLNVPATISLENIVPKAGVSVAEYIKFLQSQIGMEFISYNPVTSLWVFKVKHFSIWGLLEDDEENSQGSETSDAKRKKDEKNHEPKIYDSFYSKDETSIRELKKQKLSYETQNFPGGWQNTSLGERDPINSSRELVANEVNNQIDLFKREKLVSDLTKNTSDITLDTRTDSRSVTPEIKENTFPKGLDQQVGYLKQLVNVFPKNARIEDIIDEKAYEPNIFNDGLFNNIRTRPHLPTSDDWLIQLELSNDSNSSLNKFYTETTPLTKNVTVKSIDNILFPNFNDLLAKEKQNSIKSIPEESDEDMEDEYENPSNAKIYAKVTYHLLSKDTLYSRENYFPAVKTNLEVSFEDLLVGFASNQEHSNEEQLVKLMAILFDEHSIPTEIKDVAQNNSAVINYFKSSIQKSKFSQWLIQYNEKGIKENSNKIYDDVLETVFLNICSGDLKSAIRLCIDYSYSHLASILTLLDADDPTVKVVATNQLLAWKEASIMQHIPAKIVDIMKILSGDMDDLVKELPWNVILFLKLNYGDSSLSLREVLVSIMKSVEIKNPAIDILNIYKLLGEDRTSAFSFIKQCDLPIHFKWLLYKFLYHENDRDVDFDDLTSQFGGLLEKIGLWKESIYVYSHLLDDKESAIAIRRVVKKNIKKMDIDSPQDNEEYLTKVLKVPFALIYEAISIQKSFSNDYWGQCEALMTAKMWQEAHGVIIYHLGPECVILNSDNARDRLIDIINEFPENGSIIPDWNQGAGIYSNFFALGISNDKNTLDTLLTNLPLIKTDNSTKCKAATKIISKKVGDRALSVYNDYNFLNQKIFRMPLGENELNYFKTRLSVLV